MKALQRALTGVFRPAAARRADPHGRERTEAKRIAKGKGIEIETLRGGGFNVWPPANAAETDPFAGDHFCTDWTEVLSMVRTYSGQ